MLGGIPMKKIKKAAICSVSILSIFSSNAVYGMETVTFLQGKMKEETFSICSNEKLTTEEEANSKSYYDNDGNEFKVYSDEEELSRLQEAMGGTSYQVSLEKFRNEDSEYQYSDVLWKSSFDEVKEKLGEQVSEYEMEGTLPDSEYRFLKHTAIQELEGQKGEMYFDFLNDELQAVRYEFSLDGDYETWFQQQIKNLSDLYGEEYTEEITENEELGFKETSYKWEHENTFLQAVLITGENAKPSAAIGAAVSE